MTAPSTGTLLIVALARQMRETRFVPWICWLTVVLLSVVGEAACCPVDAARLKVL